jgi:hypothetical protein
MHIDNLYKDTTILMFKHCFALEKVHGTSAHVSWKNGVLTFSPGGCNHDTFRALFSEYDLTARFVELGHDAVTVYGEAYGGKCQGMSATYGKALQFIVFEVRIGEMWLSVQNAESVALKLGLEFVPYAEIPCDLAEIDNQRDSPSLVAVRRGIIEDKLRGGVVLRPILEFTRQNGNRIICKHKRAEFQETTHARKVGDVSPEVLAQEQAAAEWVKDMRLRHVLDALGNPRDMSDTPRVLSAMVEDVMREGAGEVEDTKETRRAIGKATLVLWKKHVQKIQNND